MIRSMTGFGEAAEQIGGIHYAVEVRSLNNKYFKATIRLPEEIMGLEAELEASLRKKISRGSLILTVKIRLPDTAVTHRINDALLTTYLDHLETIHAKVGQREQSVNIDLTALLALPGVLVPAEDELRRARPAVIKLTEKACEGLSAMRLTEGRSIAEDLATQRRHIFARIDVIRKRAPLVIEEYHTRLRARIDDLLARAALNVSEPDLIREVAIFAERSDIAEEVTRLSAHLDQFERIVEARDGEPAGRTLDFVAQELLREANTIASKSNDEEISRAIVEVKGAIDRIKEQVQNIE